MKVFRNSFVENLDSVPFEGRTKDENINETVKINRSIRLKFHPGNRSSSAEAERYVSGAHSLKGISHFLDQWTAIRKPFNSLIPIACYALYFIGPFSNFRSERCDLALSIAGFNFPAKESFRGEGSSVILHKRCTFCGCPKSGNAGPWFLWQVTQMIPGRDRTFTAMC